MDRVHEAVKEALSVVYHRLVFWRHDPVSLLPSITISVCPHALSLSSSRCFTL